MKTVWQRFWEKTEPDPATGCIRWTGRVSQYGYGHFHLDKRVRSAHRVAWELVNGPVPAGMELDHVCHTRDLTCPGGVTCPHRRCQNLAHLEPVPHGENVRRGRACKRSADSAVPETFPGARLGYQS